MEQPLVSVILPTYNRAHCLAETLNSILSQTYKNLELIVIDDGSTDDTRQLIEQFNGNIRYYYQENHGVSNARNHGIRKVQGEFIAFADSDDTWSPNKIEQQLAFFNRHPAIGLCFTDALIKKKNGKVKEKYQVIGHNDDAVYGLNEVLQDPYFGLPTVMIRTSVLNATGGFDESLKTAEDLDLYFRVALHKPVGYLHQLLVTINQCDGSLSSDEASYESNIDVLTRFVASNSDACREVGFDVQQALANIHLEYAKSLLWSGQSREARAQLKKALRYKASPPHFYYYMKSFLKETLALMFPNENGN